MYSISYEQSCWSYVRLVFQARTLKTHPCFSELSCIFHLHWLCFLWKRERVVSCQSRLNSWILWWGGYVADSGHCCLRSAFQLSATLACPPGKEGRKPVNHLIFQSISSTLNWSFLYFLQSWSCSGRFHGDHRLFSPRGWAESLWMKDPWLFA